MLRWALVFLFLTAVGAAYAISARGTPDTDADAPFVVFVAVLGVTFIALLVGGRLAVRRRSRPQ